MHMTSYPNPTPNTLSDSHGRHLEASAVDPDVTAERGTFSARRGKDVPQDGGKLPKKPGLVFPVHVLDGEVFHRPPPHTPRRARARHAPDDPRPRLPGTRPGRGGLPPPPPEQSGARPEVPAAEGPLQSPRRP